MTSYQRVRAGDRRWRSANRYRETWSRRGSRSADDSDDDSKAKKSRAAWFGSKKDEEQVMTTKERRKIEVPLDLLDNKRGEGKAGDIVRNQEIIS